MALQLSQTQQHTLSPQALQRIEMLQMNSLELVDYIAHLALENPLIELENHTITEDYVKREQYQRLQRNHIYEKSPQDKEDIQDNYQQSNNDSLLTAHLIEQVGGYALSTKSQKLFSLLLEHLGEDGRLEWDIFDRMSGYSKNELENSLFLLQSLNPAGVGARSINECLTIQLNRLPPSTSRELAISIVNDHLEALGKCHYGLIARNMRASLTEIEKAIGLIKTLNPHPCTHYSKQDHVLYVVPDLTIEWGEKGLNVIYNESNFPSIQFSGTYCNLLNTSSDQQLKNYIAEKLKQAQQVVENIYQRKNTILRCARMICKLQEGFLNMV